MKNMMMMTCIAAVASLAGTTIAQVDGDVLFTSEAQDSIRLVSGGTVSTLYSFSTDVRLAGIDQAAGSFYVASGFPSEPTDSKIFKITDLFGSPSASILDDGFPIMNPIGLEYDRGTGQLLSVNNPGFDPNIDPRFEGILGTSLAGNTNVLFEEPPLGDPNPKYRAGADITPDRISGDFFVTSDNGGVDDPGGYTDSEASTLWRLDPTTGTMDLLVDLSNSSEGTLTQVRGITTLPNGDVVITDRFSDSIYRVSLDGSGQFDSISLIAAVTTPGRIEYNRYNNTLVFGEADLDQISQINLDGSGYTVLATNVQPRGLYIVPAPSSLALLGLGGLIAVRRRR